MRSSIIQKQVINSPQLSLKANADQCCAKCGGNGYTKTSPDCYKTCLDCLGKGVVSFKS